jgi:hypothetical protein
MSAISAYTQCNASQQNPRKHKEIADSSRLVLAALVPRTRTEGGHLRNVVCHQALRFWINSTMVISRPGADPDGEAGGPDCHG